MPDIDHFVQMASVSNPLREPILRSAIQALQFPLGGRGLDAGCGIGFRLTGYRSLEAPGPGAVAHMSLHQKPTMSKNLPDINRRTAMEPRFSPGDRLSVCVWRPTQRGGEIPAAPRR